MSTALVFKDAQGNQIAIMCSENELTGVEENSLLIYYSDWSHVLLRPKIREETFLSCKITQELNCSAGDAKVANELHSGAYPPPPELPKILSEQSYIDFFTRQPERPEAARFFPEETLKDYGCKYHTDFKSRASW